MPIMQPSNSQTLILDIETKINPELLELFLGDIKAPANYKDKDKIDAYIAEKKAEGGNGMKVDTDFADILCIGIMDLDTGEKKQVSLEEFLTETIINEPRLITFNGKNFDIPILIKNGIKQGIECKKYQWLKDCCRKYNTFPMIDLMEAIGEYGKYKSLDKYCQIYLKKAKTPIDFATASDEEVIKHNLEDLDLTAELYKKFKVII